MNVRHAELFSRSKVHYMAYFRSHPFAGYDTGSSLQPPHELSLYCQLVLHIALGMQHAYTEQFFC